MRVLLLAAGLSLALAGPVLAQTRNEGVSWPSAREGDMSRPGAQDWSVTPDIRHYGISDGDVLRGGDTHLRTDRYIREFSLREAELGGPG